MKLTTQSYDYIYWNELNDETIGNMTFLFLFCFLYPQVQIKLEQDLDAPRIQLVSSYL
jgi:hypothetical protein